MIGHLIWRYRAAVVVALAGTVTTAMAAVAPPIDASPSPAPLIRTIAGPMILVPGPTITETITAGAFPRATVTVNQTSTASLAPSGSPPAAPPATSASPTPSPTPSPTAAPPKPKNRANGHDPEDMCLDERDHGIIIQVLCRLLD